MNNTIAGKFNKLPIASYVKEICEVLDKERRLIVTAPPGAGKSTLLPLALLEHLADGRIIMLEPRRLAARQVAERMAQMLGEHIGETVGYRVRFDTKVSSGTRIEVVTDGVMERMLADDPTLEGVSVVIFDEFHERNLSSDLALTLTRQVQTLLREDLKILVMSATIDAKSLSDSFDASYIECSGSCHEVRVKYCDDYDAANCAQVMARIISKVLREETGDILAFLPGQGEIEKCRHLLSENVADVEILAIYGMLSQEEQKRVLSPPSPGKRRIILATPIAETSLTIEGITIVVDSGLYKTSEYQPSTGLSRLVTRRISMDMATQRMGRAGRLGPGVCYRLWSKVSDHRMKETREPEILTADLSSLLLTLSGCGETDVMRLPWITPPPSGKISNARQLLQLLGAIRDDDTLTEKGKNMAHLPCHPRISSMLFESGGNSLACDIAAILEERDLINDETDADIITRIDALNSARRGPLSSGWRRIDNISKQYIRLLKRLESPNKADVVEPGILIASAYPERIAKREDNGKYRLAYGNTYVSLHPSDNLERYELLAVAAMGSRIYLAAPVRREWLESRAATQERIRWDSRQGRVVAAEELRYGLLTLSSRNITERNTKEIITAIAEAAPKEGLTMFDFNDDVQELQTRIAVASEWHPELKLPDISTELLLSKVGEWLPYYIGKATTVQELRKIDLAKVIIGLLDYEQQIALDTIVPTHLRLPSGRNVRILYRRGADAPVVSARLQDCFGLLNTPKVDDGKRPVLMELLSPGFKPVQLTQDMAGFWQSTYFGVRKDLRRRYPKHRWPENPLEFCD